MRPSPLQHFFTHDRGQNRFLEPEHALYLAHVLVGEPASTSPEHALDLAHGLVGEPASTSPEHALDLAHGLVGEPASTSPEHALCRPRAVDARALSTKIRFHP